MNPRILQQNIHSCFSVDFLVWEIFRNQISDNESIANYAGSEHGSHIMREFNRKLNDLNIEDKENLEFFPYDAGFRYFGDF